MIGLPWSQEGLCYRRDRNFFHSSNSLQLGGRPPPALKFNSYLETDMEVDIDKDVDMDNLIDMDIDRGKKLGLSKYPPKYPPTHYSWADVRPPPAWWISSRTQT